VRLVRVVAGAVERNGQVLLALRGPHTRNAGLWELPGGKVEPGETDAEALVRELQEELGVEVRVGERLGACEHAYAHAAILLVGYRCELIGGVPIAREHAELRWVRPSDWTGLATSEADRPLLARLAAILSG